MAVEVTTTSEDEAAVRSIVDDRLAAVDDLTDDILAGEMDVF